MAKQTGGCACGAIRFAVSGDFLGTGVCHCTECQKLSGGGANYVALVAKPALTITKGTPKEFVTKGDSGADAVRLFCGDCGTPLWSKSDSAPFYPVKIGAFDQSADYAPGLHLYTASAPNWHLMHEGIPAFPKMPPENT
jgi:hypothetical protein